jgi:YHS domain-containing protein
MSGQLGNILYFLALAGLFVFMMRFGCGAHIMGHGHRHGGASADEHGAENPRWVAPERAVDPVCGMTVQTATAKSAVHDGHVYYFCSQDCRQKFEAAPVSYVKPLAA